jgi:hypothetical protein
MHTAEDECDLRADRLVEEHNVLQRLPEMTLAGVHTLAAAEE